MVSDVEGIPYIEYKLPNAVQQLAEAWKACLVNGSIVTTLLVAVEAQLLSLIPLYDSQASDTPSITALKFFSYAGVFINLIGTLISVFLLEELLNLPLNARILCLEEPESFPRKLFMDRGNSGSEKEEYVRLLKGRNDGVLLSKFGMRFPWNSFTGMWMLSVYFGCGCIFVQLSLYLWNYETRIVTGPLMMFVIAALAISLTPILFYRSKTKPLSRMHAA